MNRTATALARKVAARTATPAEIRDFKAAMGLLGYEGARGLGVVNHTTGGVAARSWVGLAEMLLAELAESVNEAHEEAAEMVDYSDDSLFPTRGLLPEVDAARDRKLAEVADSVLTAATRVGTQPGEEGSFRITYLYETRTPTITLSVDSRVSAFLVSEETAYTEGSCQSQASLECDPEDPNTGFLRILPESMLPGAVRDRMIQCVPCYDASAEAYVRKLHSTFLL